MKTINSAAKLMFTSLTAASFAGWIKKLNNRKLFKRLEGFQTSPKLASLNVVKV